MSGFGFSTPEEAARQATGDILAGMVRWESPIDAPIPLLLWCPSCHERHVDAGEFVTKPHHTHACQSCGMVWRPAIQNTVGVQYLPGFKDADPSEGPWKALGSFDEPPATGWGTRFDPLGQRYGLTPSTLARVRGWPKTPNGCPVDAAGWSDHFRSQLSPDEVMHHHRLSDAARALFNEYLKAAPWRKTMFILCGGPGDGKTIHAAPTNGTFTYRVYRGADTHDGIVAEDHLYSIDGVKAVYMGWIGQRAPA